MHCRYTSLLFELLNTGKVTLDSTDKGYRVDRESVLLRSLGWLKSRGSNGDIMAFEKLGNHGKLRSELS